MPVIVFVLGSPGSGKSTACRIINSQILQRNIVKSVAHLRDYEILWKMFLNDQLNPPDLRKFEPTKKYKGFNVKPHAYPVFDSALRHANEMLKIWLAGGLQGIVVEFSRNDYTHAFIQFETSLLQNAHFLFLEASEELCRARLHERVKHPATPDDHFVSDYILDAYYSTSKFDATDLCSTYGIKAHRIKTISNNGSLADFIEEIKRFVDTTLLSSE